MTTNSTENGPETELGPEVELGLEDVTQYTLRILEDSNIQVAKDAKILDYGCGSGRFTLQYISRGFANTYGFDITNYLNDEAKQQPDRFRFSTDRTDSRNYNPDLDAEHVIPYESDSFDFVFSYSVFEHVLNKKNAFQEIHRVLKPGGIGLHFLPSLFRPIEPHIFVPFGQLIRNYYYYLLCAKLGIRNTFQAQKNMTAKEVAKDNLHYSHTGISYISLPALSRMISELYSSHSYEEISFIRNSRGRSNKLLSPLMARLPFLVHFYRNLHTIVLLTKK